MTALQVNYSLKAKLTALFILMLLLPAAIIGYVADMKARDLLHEGVLAEKQAHARRAAEKLEQYLVDSSVSISALANMPALRAMKAPEQVDALKAFQTGLGTFELIFVIDAAGNIQNTYPQTDFGGKTNFTDRQWYKDVVSKQSVVISDTYISAFTKQATAPIVAPIRDDKGIVIGYVGGNLSLSNLKGIADELSAGGTGNGIIVDKAHYYLQDSRNEKHATSHEQLNFEKLRTIIEQGKSSVTQVMHEGVPVLVAFAPVPAAGWSVFGLQHAEEAAASANDLRVAIIGVLIASVLLAAGLVSWYVKQTVSPLLAVANSAGLVAAGDLTAEDIQYTASDEIGCLVMSFTDMKSHLRTIIHHVTATADTLTQSAQTLAATSEQSAASSANVAQASSDIVAKVENQAQKIAIVTSAAVSVSESAQKTAAVVAEVSKQAQETARQAESGSSLIESAVDQMHAIEIAVEKSSQAAAILDQRSQVIGVILNTISGIANQTNLLALNAAIEAARAGEAGRGFSVVAEEVRKLAEQSEAAARQIANELEEIQNGTTAVVQSMAEGIAEAKTGGTAALAAGQAFQRIRELVDQVAKDSQAVTASVTNVSATTKDLAVHIQAIEKIGEEMVTDISNVSAAAQEQNAAMEEIAAASAQLTGLAEILDQSVNKFHS